MRGLRGYIKTYFKKSKLILLNSIKLNKKMDSKFNKTSLSSIELPLYYGVEKKEEVDFDKFEVNDIKFPTFDDFKIEDQLKKDVTYDSLVFDVHSCSEALNNFSKEYDLIFESKNFERMKRYFDEHNMNFISYKIYAQILDRQITLIYFLIKKKFIKNSEEIEQINIKLKENYSEVDRDLLARNILEMNKQYFSEEGKIDSIDEIVNRPVIELIENLFKNEQELVQFDNENQDYIPSFTSISIALKIMKSIFDDVSLQLLEFKDVKYDKEDLFIKFLHYLSKLEIFVSYLTLTYKVPNNDIFNQPENSEEWKRLKKNYERRVLYSRHVLNKKLQQVYKMVTLGNASISKGYGKFDWNYFKIIGSGWYMVFFFFNQKQANLQNIKFAINPDFKVAQKIWNMLDARIIRNVLKLTMPKIKYSKKLYLKRTCEQIDLNKIKELENLSKNYSFINTEMKIEFENKMDVNEVKYENDNKFHNTNELMVQKVNEKNSKDYVKTKIIHHTDFYIPIKKSFWNFLNCFPSLELNSNRNSIIIHIHGGGFIAMSPSSHENYTRKWASALKVPIFSIDYRLAPQNPYPNALDDVYQVYMWIVNHAEDIMKMKIENIILVGDSAGGNLCTALTYLLILMKKRLPTALFLAYPALKVTSKDVSISFFNCLSDQILPYHLVKYCLDSYRSDYDNERDPFISPVYMDEKVLSFMPPVRIIQGSSDPLRDDAIIFTKKLTDLEKDVKLIELKYFPHGFLNYDFPLMMPEASVASDIIVKEMEKFISKS